MTSKPATHPDGDQPPELFHVGLLVANIATAKGRLESVLGLQFHDPVDIDLLVETMLNSEPHSYTSRLCYSTAGPIYTELVQADGSDYKSISQGERIHHLGYWVFDVKAQRARQRAAGVRDEVVIRYPGSRRIRQWFTDPLTLNGIRAEYFDAAWRPSFETWMAEWDPHTASTGSTE